MRAPGNARLGREGASARWRAALVPWAVVLGCAPLPASSVPTAIPRPIQVVAGGDLSLAGTLPDAPLGGLAPLLRGDLRFLNLEGPLTTRGATTGLLSDGTPDGRPVRLRADPARAAWLRGLVDVVSLANNHALDQGGEGLEDTARALAAVGIEAASAEGERVMERGGQRVTVLARHFPPDAPLDDVGELEGAIARARRGGPVLVSLHWGHTGSALPDPAQRRLAARLVDAGASAVLGHGPHAVQGVELRGGALVAYSLGNIAFGCRCTDVRDGLLLTFTLAPDGRVSDVTGQPIDAGIQGTPAISRDPDLAALIVDLSARLGTRAIASGASIRFLPAEAEGPAAPSR